MKKKVFKGMILLSIIAFLGLYYAYANGYAESKRLENVVLTNQKIEEFEKDISEGKDISLEDYFEEEKDYSTKTSKMSLNLSAKVSNFFDRIIKFFFQKLGSALE